MSQLIVKKAADTHNNNEYDMRLLHLSATGDSATLPNNLTPTCLSLLSKLS